MTEPGLDLSLLERRLGQIRGVISARVMPGLEGGIGEVHVMASSQRAPKQVVRDIESLVLLHFQQKVDYRKISIVQLESRRITPLNRVRLKSVEMNGFASPQTWSVVLEYDRQDLQGNWEGHDSATEAEGAARATLSAVSRLTGPSMTLDLVEARLTEMGGRPAVFASVALIMSTQEETLLGSSFVKGSVAEAAARSVLAALNRRLPFTVE